MAFLGLDLGLSSVNDYHSFFVRRLATIASTFYLKNEYHHCLTGDATIMVMYKCPIIG